MMIEKNLVRFAGLFSDYTELREQETRFQVISFLNGNLVGNLMDSTGGVSARVYRSGRWGFASSPERDDGAVRKVLSEAAINAVFLESKAGPTRGSLPPSAAQVNRDLSTAKPRLGQKELVEFTTALDRHIVATFKEVTSRRVIIQNLDIEKSLATAAGARCYTMIPRSIIYIMMSGEQDGRPVEVLEFFGGLGQFEDVFTSPGDLFPAAERLYRRLLDKKEGELPEAGVADCVLDSRLAGMLAHEAVGHTTEADRVLGGSVAADNLEKQVASPLFSLVDFASHYSGTLCPVPVFADDEGALAQDTILIDRGVLKGYMHNRESALELGAAPTGNARAWAFSDEPLIRMRNTAILPGTSNLEEMIASIDHGYYLCATGNGQADSTGEFTFSVNQGYRIRKGKLDRAILDSTITGVAFEMLKTVSMVSDEMHWDCSGFCGKKQLMSVGMGGPALKCRVMVGGK